MTTDLDPNMPDDEKLYQRYLTGQLRLMGFQDGAPIQRASEGFTLDDLKAALFPSFGKDEGSLKLIARGGEEICFRVIAVRNFDLTVTGYAAPDLAGHLFVTLPGTHSPASNFDCFIVSGLLERAHMLHGKYVDDVMVQTTPYTPSSDQAPSEWSGALAEYEDRTYLKVTAVVAFDSGGRFGEALVQCPPSPLDQILAVPEQ